jgi:hypothetical protein
MLGLVFVPGNFRGGAPHDKEAAFNFYKVKVDIRSIGLGLNPDGEQQNAGERKKNHKPGEQFHIRIPFLRNGLMRVYFHKSPVVKFRQKIPKALPPWAGQRHLVFDRYNFLELTGIFKKDSPQKGEKGAQRSWRWRQRQIP